MKLIKQIAMYGIAAMSLLTAGCADEPAMGYIQQGEGSLRLHFEVDGDMPVTRATAVAVAHEKRLNQVHLLFFDTSDGDRFVAYKQLEVGSGATTLSFDPPEVLTPGTPFKVLAVGNGDTFVPAGNQSFNQYLSTIEGSYSEVMGTLKGQFKDLVTYRTPGRLPMFGTFRQTDSQGNVLPGDTTFTVQVDGANKTIKEADRAKFFFKRSLCRFDLTNLCSNVLDIKYVRVVNSPDGGYFFSDGLIGGEIPEYSEANPEIGEKGYMPMDDDNGELDGVQSSAQKLTATLYGFPNVVNTTVVNDRVTTALMISGYYTDPETGQTDDYLTYYRFNLANLGEAQVLNRNTCYKAIIKGVNGRGHDNEPDAYNSNSPHFKYEVDEEWDTTGDNVASDEDGNFMILSRTRFTFPGNVTESDYFELKVSTNPELKWTVKADDTMPGQENDYFELTPLTDAQGNNIGVKCAPKLVNDTEYVRYGYFNVIGTNPKTGKTLKKMIYLMQLTMGDNVKTLTVDGQLGTIEYELNPNGDDLWLPVVTGSKGNMWSATDVGDSFKAWGTAADGYELTTEGDNNSTLHIKVTANLTGERTAEITVQLKVADDKVKPVTILLKQKKCAHYLDIIGVPDDTNRIEIKGSDFTESGVEWAKNHPNGFTQDLKTVRIKLTAGGYSCKVTHTFDNKRDLKIGTYDRRNTEEICYHPYYDDGRALLKYTSAGTPNPDWENDDELDGCKQGSVIYLNAFLMGPGDPMIDGTVTVSCYADEDPDKILEQRSFNVRIKPDTNYEINDVILPSTNSNYMIIADRNYGTSPRIAPGSNVIHEALWYTNEPSIYITGLHDQPATLSQIAYMGDECMVMTSDGTFYHGAESDDPLTQWKQDHSLNNEFYYETQFKWEYLTLARFGTMINHSVQTKWRRYVVSPYRKQNGNIVMCWLPWRVAEPGGGTISHFNYDVAIYYVSDYPHVRQQNTVALNFHGLNSSGNYNNVTNEGYYSRGRTYYAYHTNFRLCLPLSASYKSKIAEVYGLNMN